MSDKERHRKAVFEMVKQKRLMLTKASKQCELSYRQTLRLYKAYLGSGDAGLIHANRGRPSNRENPHREEIIDRYAEKYEGFGPTLATEYLKKDGYKISHETLRTWLTTTGLWEKQRKRSPYRQRRERKEQFGELVQIDGSIHDWFQTGQHSCLLNMVDDATGKTLSKLANGETTRVLFDTMMEWIKRYGIPMAVYVDLKTTYVSPKQGGLSHFQKACKKLGIRIIKAHSPQAKGRVERSHAVYQDRFVKALSLQGAKTIEVGNAMLSGGFIDELNERFEKPARNPQTAHCSLGDIDLEQIFCWEYQRQIQHDWTFSFNGIYYQVHKAHGDLIKPKSMIIVRKHLDGSVSVWRDDKALIVKELQHRSAHEKSEKIEQSKEIHERSVWLQGNGFLFQPTHEMPHRFTLRKRTS